MNKEILDELLDNLGKKLEKIKKIDNKCKEALKMSCKIHIDNDGKGTRLAVEGSRLSLLITLVGAEKSILKELNCTNEEFNFIKNMVDTMEAKDE